MVAMGASEWSLSAEKDQRRLLSLPAALSDFCDEYRTTLDIFLIGLTVVYFVVAFCESVPDLNDGSAVWEAAHVIFNVIFLMDMLRRMNYAPNLEHFCRHWFDVIELASQVAFWSQMAQSYGRLESSGLNGFGIAVFLRTKNLVLTITALIWRKTNQLDALTHIVLESRPLLVLTCCLIFIMMMFCSILTYTAEKDAEPYGQPFHSVPAAMWYFVNVITTVGFGDMAPVTTAGRVVCSLIIVANSVSINLPLSIITVIIMQDFSKVMKREAAHKRTQSSSDLDMLGFAAQIKSSPYTWGQEWREYVHLLLVDPSYSALAKWVGRLVFVLAFGTILVEVAGTHESVDQDAVHTLNDVLVPILCVEFLLRAVTTPDPYLKHLRSAWSVVDILAIVFYLLGEVAPSVASFTNLRRFFRTLRMVHGLRAIGLTQKVFNLYQNMGPLFPALVSMAVMYAIFAVMGAVMIFYFDRGRWDEQAKEYVGEDGQRSKFQSMFDGLWWASQTMTTVGYGDAVPLSVRAKILASLYEIITSISLTLPVSIIGANYCVAFEETEQASVHSRRAVLIKNLELPENREVLKSRLHHFDKDMEKLNMYFNSKYPFHVGPQHQDTRRNIHVRRLNTDEQPVPKVPNMYEDETPSERSGVFSPLDAEEPPTNRSFSFA